MAGFGGYYKGEKKKPKRERLEKQAEKIRHMDFAPRVEIIGKGKKSK